MSDDLLDELLTAWRVQPDPELASLVARAGVVAGRGREAITGTTVAELSKRWFAVEQAGDPADLDRLLTTLVEGRCEDCIKRVEKLAKRPRDPRFVERLVTLAEADPKLSRGETSPVPFTSPPNRKFWTTLLPIVEARADASIAARLQKVIARKPTSRFEEWLATKLGKIVAVLEPAPAQGAKTRVVVKKLAAQLAKLDAQAQPSADTSLALYEAVWADPDDDGPRVVLADFLMENGDPRGEFISLQLARAAGTLNAAGKQREKELLKRHKKQWLGPIQPLIQPHFLRFERGFLATCSLEPNRELEKTLGDHSAWSTIKEFLVHDFAAVTGRPLKKMLKARGAKQTDGTFTVGVE